MRIRFLAPLVFLLALLVLSTPVLAYGRGFSPNYDATFTGGITGGGPVQVAKPVKNLMSMSSDAMYNNYPLTFASVVFDAFVGEHWGYLGMARRSVAATTIEIRYTWGPDGYGDYYHLHGFGTFTSTGGRFIIVSHGSYTISESGPLTDWVWQQRWQGTPSFTIVGSPI
jgi:hypothetical protein